MNWQENVVLQRSKGPEKSSGEPQGDSKILRYIKTLTNHQKKAKQQRMDQYMQQVKRPRPVERDIKSWKSSQDLSTTGRLHPHETQSKESSMQFVKNPPKRSYEEKQSYRQQKKPKRAPSKQQVDVVGSLDRFRLNGTWAQDKRQTRENECSGTLHSSTGSKTTQQLQTQTSTYQAQTRTVNPVLDKFTSGLNQRGIEKLPVEV
ncbi:hypothetical protein PHMEG_00033880 [Phytophthora megakarya]|uniref:Uncharacterized protein n=1 Tax=Phytophthora megakarya TaxID=4795 RepID=A0A225USA5_9STRA|nr:hypothetical protein PHMEG_00033880 [Phytophthora megakarya]